MEIMVVDDLEENRYLLQKLLEGYGYSVETASNGVEALEKARESPPDMIITDVLMPKMDGFQLCRELKKDEELKSIPVLFYSGTYTDKQSQKLALDIGAAGYLIKPTEPDVLIKIVKETIEKYEKGEFKPPEKTLGEEEYMKLYNERLIQKLEKKMLDLEREISERKLAEEHIEHLNSVLKAIRSVNQLIIVEKDRGTLLQKACDVLMEARGYDATWLGFSEDGETLATVKGSGFMEDVSRFCEHVISGDHPLCIKNALVQKDRLVVWDKSRDCEDCIFKNAHIDKKVAIIRVEHAGKLFGLLAILLAPDAAVDDEEKELLQEVAGDIAFALHDMEAEEARKKAEDQIKASLKEKEVLLREIHHRVKNNLQVMSSLLNMQARATKDKKTIDILSESRNRLNAMALIHSQLYESSNFSEVNIKRFIEGLLLQLFRNYPVQDTKITPVVHIDEYPLPISIAVPTGLVVNEFLANAFKHAFVNRKEGKIEVSLSASEKGKITLTVSDDGVGLPEGFDINATKTLGMRLIKILVEDQLQGKLEVVSDKGTTFKIIFELENNRGS